MPLTSYSALNSSSVGIGDRFSRAVGMLSVIMVFVDESLYRWSKECTNRASSRQCRRLLFLYRPVKISELLGLRTLLDEIPSSVTFGVPSQIPRLCIFSRFPSWLQTSVSSFRKRYGSSFLRMMIVVKLMVGLTSPFFA